MRRPVVNCAQARGFAVAEVCPTWAVGVATAAARSCYPRGTLEKWAARGSSPGLPTHNPGMKHLHVRGVSTRTSFSEANSR
jgi:hypothetical protein